MKYIVIGDLDLLIFPEHLEHAQYARNNGGIDKVRSAGFVGYTAEGRLHCYGESLSLNIPSNPKQDNLLLRLLLK